MSQRVLYVLACGSGSAHLVYELLPLAQETGWDVCVITTPNGRKFLNMPLLAQITGHPVRSEYKQPDEPDLLPRANALIVYPATFNTLNKWALGITDTLAVGLLCEYTGLKTPIVAVPRVGEGLNAHPALEKSIETLRSYGVTVLYESEKKIAPDAILAELHKMTG